MPGPLRKTRTGPILTAAESGRLIADDLLYHGHWQGDVVNCWDGEVCMITCPTYQGLRAEERESFYTTFNRRIGAEHIHSTEELITFNDTHPLHVIIEILRSL